ncbi:Programmed cell death protein 2 [Anthophora retusa]
MAVDLGFIERCEAWRLESRFFPSKVGGKPAWLDLKCIPDEEDLRCEYCKEPCLFLCQVYAPYEDNENAFHRTIFVFVCKKSGCCRSNENGNVKVFRSQLARVNEFYPPEPPVEQNDWRNDICVDQWVKTCYICGILAPHRCSKCKSVYYCCRAHQIYDWKHGHKESCDTTRKITKCNQLLFPEYEIIIEQEDTEDENNANDVSKEQEEIKKYETMLQEGEAGTLQHEDVQNELLSMANQTEDETFSKFCSITDKYPDQILRYNRGGDVLYISAENKIDEVPKCSECNGERQFEFQIMPQLLNFLELENTLKCIDWGILTVYTCVKSCIPKNGYIMEYIWKQDIDFDDTS